MGDFKIYTDQPACPLLHDCKTSIFVKVRLKIYSQYRKLEREQGHKEIRM